jgi:hypothetical protein
MTNLQWFEKNKEKMGRFAGRWVAVFGEAVVADAASFAEVHATLTKRNVNGALIVRVPENVTNRPRLIA